MFDNSSNTLFENLLLGVKEHLKVFGIAAAIIGVLLVIYYSGSIRYYPSGLTIADTLFFLWVVIVFGFYYSLVVLAYFLASLFWIAIFKKPIIFLLNLNSKFQINIPKVDLLTVISGGLLANIIIFYVAYFSNISNFSVLLSFGAMFIIGLFYILTQNIPGQPNKIFIDSKGLPIPNKYNSKLVKLTIYLIIYLTPISIAQVGGGITKTTFETMGVRQMKVDILINSSSYKPMLDHLSSKGLVSKYKCDQSCIVEDVNILFTSIGSNSKIEIIGDKGSVDVVIPTKSISMLVHRKPFPEKQGAE